MSSTKTLPRASNVSVNEEKLIVPLKDGRTITAPLSWFPSLLQASPEQRRRHRLIGGGEGIHWPDIDEDLSVAGLLAEINRRGLTAMLVPASQVGSFTLSGSSLRSRKGRKPARSVRRSIPDKINNQSGIYAPLMSGSRSSRPAA
jgi:hypothetical protein